MASGHATSATADEPGRQRGGRATAARLQLLQKLLTSTSVAGCAGESLSWLSEAIAIPCALAAIRAEGERHFRIVATSGLDPEGAALRTVNEEREAYSLFRSTPHTIPLAIRDTPPQAPVGFVLHLGRLLSPDVADWFGDVVARRLDQLLNLEGDSRSRSLLLTNMSHEFRTPLNAMLGYTSMLRQGVAGELPPPALRQLARIESNGRHLDAVVSAMIDISAMEAGQMPLTLTRFDLRAVIARALAPFETVIRDAALAIVVDVPDDVSQIMSDERKVERILVNLLSNALKFTHEGSVTIAARKKTDDDVFEISVTDTGTGVAADEQAGVLQDFRDSNDSSTRAYGGMGLGLSVSQRLARFLGGAITLDSRLGHGARFALTLPLRERR